MDGFSVQYLTHAPVAQLDRVLASEAKGRAFESRRARQSQTVRGALSGRVIPVRNRPWCVATTEVST